MTLNSLSASLHDYDTKLHCICDAMLDRYNLARMIACEIAKECKPPSRRSIIHAMELSHCVLLGDWSEGKSRRDNLGSMVR